MKGAMRGTFRGRPSALCTSTVNVSVRFLNPKLVVVVAVGCDFGSDLGRLRAVGTGGEGKKRENPVGHICSGGFGWVVMCEGF